MVRYYKACKRHWRSLNVKKKFKSDQERIIHEIDKHTRERHFVKAVYIHPNIKLDENVVKPYPVFRKNSIDGWYIELA